MSDNIETIKASQINDDLIADEGEAPESWRDLVKIKPLFYIEGDGFFAIMTEERIIEYAKNLIDTNLENGLSKFADLYTADDAARVIRWAGEEIFKIAP